MTIPLKNWLLGALFIFVSSLFADYFFIHYLFSNKKEAQIEKFNEGVVEYLNKKCDTSSSENSHGSGTSSAPSPGAAPNKTTNTTPTCP